MDWRYSGFVKRIPCAPVIWLALLAPLASAYGQIVGLTSVQIGAGMHMQVSASEQVRVPAPAPAIALASEQTQEPRPAQPGTPRTEPASIILLAHPGLTDPNFARTVVLVTRTPGDDTIGVILNRRLRVGAQPLPDELAGRDVYFGGPLAPRGLLGIGPQPTSSAEERADRDNEIDPSGVVAVLPGLQLVVGSRRVRALAAAPAPERVKIFSGYAGWAPRQLENEIARGGWFVQAATEAIVFDTDPDTLWERLTARARAVRGPAPPAPAACAAPYNACLVRMYSFRSIERTSISRTSLP